MTEDEFIQLVQEAEREVDTRAGTYRMKLTLFALLGYAVIFLILLTLFSLLGGVVAAAIFSTSAAVLLLKSKLLIPVFIMIWVMVKSLWVKFEKPTGYELDRTRFPRLFREIDVLREELQSLPIHQVILTPELNAAVVQTPRLGVLGWQHNTLFLGLELLLLMSPEEARSVLAHEFGHLSRNHSRFAAWIYRIRFTWQRIMEGFHENGSVGARVLQRFFDWYAPKFSAYSFALARNNEYEADAVAAGLTSVDAMASALINVNVTGPYVDENYWDWFFRKADKLPEPDHMPYAGLAGFLSENLQSREDIRTRLDQQLNVQTSYDDTHPSLKDRLAGLGTGPVDLQPAGNNNAAIAWLGENCEQVISDFDSSWYERTRDKWSERYAYVQDATAQLADLEQRPVDSLDWQEHWNLASWTEEFHSGEEALPIYRHYQSRFPQDLDAAYVIGRLLYAQGSDECIPYLEDAAAKDDLTLRACELAYYHLLHKGADDAAEVWRQRALERMELDQRIAGERDSLPLDVELAEPDIGEELMNALVAQLSASRHVKAAWIAQRRVEFNPEDPVYVVAFKSRGFYWSWENVMERVASGLDIPAHVFCVVKGGDYRKLAKRVIKTGRRIL